MKQGVTAKEISVGAVEILRDRMYKELDGADGARDVFVKAGVYPAFRDDEDRIFWRITGVVSERVGGVSNFQDLGGGLFAAEITQPRDVVSEEPAVCESGRFTPEEWEEYQEHPEFLPGTSRRIVFMAAQ